MKVLACGYDPGGISAITPVINELLKKKYEVVVYSINEGIERFSNNGINCKELPLETIKHDSKLEHWLKKMNISVVLTGTSAYNDLEKKVWKAAQGVGIKSHAVLDFWFNLSIRFHLTPKSTIDCNYEIQILPDFIYVADKYVYNKLIGLGVRSSKIYVSGHPRLYEFFISNREKVRNHPQNIERFILYSEPINKIYNSNERWGFDEYTVIDILFNAIKQIDKTIKVIIKPHPKQKLDLYEIDRISKKYSVGYHVLKERVNIGPGDIVFGSFTIALVESLLMRAKVISIIPSVRADKYSVLSEKQLGQPARDASELANVIEKNSYRPKLPEAFHFCHHPAKCIVENMEVEYEKISD